VSLKADAGSCASDWERLATRRHWGEIGGGQNPRIFLPCSFSFGHYLVVSLAAVS